MSATTDQRVVVDWDHHDPQASHDRPAFVARTLEHPIFWTERHGGFWVVARNPLVRELDADPETFSSAKRPDGTGGITIPAVGPRLIPPETDPPYHTRIRGILKPLFLWKAVLALRPMIEEIASAALDQVVAAGEFDIETLALHVPSELISRRVGFPDETRPIFVESVRHVLALETNTAEPDPETLRVAQEAYGRLQSTVSELLARRRAEPADDIASLLVQLDDPPLTEEELFSLCLVLYIGGTDNISSMIANTLVYLDFDRELRARIIAEPEIFPAVYKELMRYISVSPGLARTATRDAELGGARIATGERLFGSLWAANYDPSVFTEPERVIVDRPEANEAIPFGHGTHTCLGVGLTRLQMEVVVGEVLRRIPDYSVDHDRARRIDDAHTVYAWATVPAQTNL